MIGGTSSRVQLVHQGQEISYSIPFQHLLEAQFYLHTLIQDEDRSVEIDSGIHFLSFCGLEHFFSAS